MVSIGSRLLKYVTWLRSHSLLVILAIAAIEITVCFLDYLINNDVPVTQLHWISIILAATIFGLTGAAVAALSATFLFYVANFLARGRTLDWAVLPGILLTLGLFGLVGMTALLIIRLLASLENSNRALAEKLQQLQASTARIELLTAERERNRLARELHDGVAKTLFGIEYAAGALEQLLPPNLPQSSPALQQARFIQEVSRQEGQAVRDIILDLRQGYEEPLFKLVGDYLNRWQLAYGQPVEYRSTGTDTDLAASLAYEVMAILEEALENIHRHSQARKVWVEIEVNTNHNLRLEVRDNGVGLNHETADILRTIGYPGPLNNPPTLLDIKGHPHFGLTGMIERAAWLNGTLELAPAKEGGLGLKLCISPVR